MKQKRPNQNWTRHRDRKPQMRGRSKTTDGPVYLYGMHTIEAALSNPKRKRHKLYATPNALRRLEERNAAIDVPIETCRPKDIGKLVPLDAVHQGLVLVADPLTNSEPAKIQDANLILALDQITDPHNVGAIMRTAVAMNVDALVTTYRNSPVENPALAKSASGAMDMISHLQVQNLSRFLTEMGDKGFQRIALDSQADSTLESINISNKVLFVLGSEGKGVRKGVCESCDATVRLEMPGRIKSLNVSNAAAICLYSIRQRIQQ